YFGETPSQCIVLKPGFCLGNRVSSPRGRQKPGFQGRNRVSGLGFGFTQSPGVARSPAAPHPEADRMDANSRAPRVSLVIPAFNEAAVIGRAVREAEAALGALFERYEILVVDDGSTDETADAVRAVLPFAPHARLIGHPTNRGYGAALRTGFEAARFELIAFTDADCQFDLSDLGKLVALAAEVPIVAGYRADRQDPWRRRFLSRGYNALARVLLGTRVRDCDCALKVFRREALANLLPE